MRCKGVIVALLVLASAFPALGRQRAQGWCERGGVSLTVGGLPAATPKAQGSYPGCTVTAYDTGTLDLANLFSDNLGTPKSNPFVADLVTGYWFFYSDDGRYDIRFSGGGIATPFTLTDVQVFDIPGSVTGHNLFSATHLDTVSGSALLGDLPYANSTPAWARLAGNITTTRKLLRQVGTGAVSAAPAWDVLIAGDIPSHTHIEGDVTNLVTDLAAKVPTTRAVNTSSPLGGGGALSGDLTLTCTTCEVTTNKNASNGYAGLDVAARLTLAQGQEVWASSDLTDFANKSGTGATILGTTLTGIALKDTLRWNGSNWVNNPQPTLDEIRDPAASKTFTMAGNSLAFNFTDIGMTSTTSVTVDPVGELIGFSVAANRTAITNGAFELTGIEGVARSRGADEAGTFRGGLFRTYIDPTFTATARTSIGMEASARAGTGSVAEGGTAFVGARIWMAPDFTAGSLGNINNFHGLWVYNEHATNAVTNAIFVSDAGAGYTNGLNFNGALLTNEFQFSNAMTLKRTGTNAWDGLTLTKSTTSGPTVGNEGVGLFIENNRTAAIVDQATVTGIEAVARSRSSGVNLTIRGGHFRTYVDDTLSGTAITSVGLDGSARASGAVVAAPGTAFVGIRSYMAPGFTGGTLPNVTNFHAFWGYNESATQAVTNGFYLSDAGGGYTYGLNLSAATIATAAIKTGAQLVDFGGKTQAPRFHSSGTALVAGDFVATGWGAGAALSLIRGTDQAFSVTVTAGTAPGANPTVDLTFTDGTWTTVPVFVCKQSSGSDAISDVRQAETATTLTLAWQGTPVDSKTYQFSCVGFGI